MSRGLIIGKFLPPHRGHQYLVDFARHYVDELTVQVCSIASEPIPGSLRFAWMREAFGGADSVHVVHNPDENPQVPEECPDRFWDIWRESIRRHMAQTPDFLFASETYGLRLAEVLRARYIPVDQARELIPIAGTAIREDPMRHWEYILPVARPWFLRRVAIVGPESSGKSTLARLLAAHYGTCYAAEYARSYLDATGIRFDGEVLATIARGHRASEEALARQANRILFSDTECLVTKLWSQLLIGSVPCLVEEMVREDRYDLYLVTAATEAWAGDPQRFQPEMAARREFEQQCIDSLTALKRRYVRLDGTWEKRQAQAIEAVDALLRERD